MKNPRVFVSLLLGVLVACAIATLGQESPKDVKGWGKVKWDMTVTQAKESYPDAKPSERKEEGPTVGYVEKLVIKDFALGDLSMKVSIETRPKSDLVKAVSLEPGCQERISCTANLGGTYSHLKDSLTQKYGQPTDQEKDRDGASSATWTFRSTVIKLVLVEGVVSFLFLNYVATDVKTLDSL
jgi:hypothetical protein